MRRVRLALLTLTVAALAGCGGGLALVPVEGTVFGPDGQPMPDVLVLFTPEASDGKVLGSSAVTDPSGRYVLKADDGRPGAVPGQHRVTLIDNAFANDDSEPSAKGPRGKPRANRIHPYYADASRTPFKEKVDGGKKVYDLKVGGGK